MRRLRKRTVCMQNLTPLVGMHAIFYTTDAGNILSTEFTVEVAEVIRIGTVEEIESIMQKVNHGPVELTHKESRD